MLDLVAFYDDVIFSIAVSKLIDGFIDLPIALHSFDLVGPFPRTEH